MKTMIALMLVAGSFAAFMASTAAATPRETCTYDAAFKLEVGQKVYAAGFLGLIRSVQYFEQQGAYDIVRHGYQSTQYETIPPPSIPCNPALLPLRAAGIALEANITRIDTLFAAFPLHARASTSDWTAVLKTALAGNAAALRVAALAGTPKQKVDSLESERASLRAILKGLTRPKR